ncbi:MAG: glycosyl transferase family 1 [Micromonosporaceae bacterium]
MAAGVPLMVYAGRPDRDRTVGVVVPALRSLPGHHLALVGPNPHAGQLLAHAVEAGVRRRVHVINRWAVPPGFLDSADLAIAGFERTPSAPRTRSAAIDAYTAAGLPIVAVDSRVTRDALDRYPEREFFASGDRDSFLSAVRRLEQAHQDADPAATGARRPEPAPAAAEPEPAPGAGGTPTRTPTRWPLLGTRPIRLGLGTANFAGQLSALAWALCRERDDVSAEVVTAQPRATFAHPSDVVLHFPTEHRLDTQLAQLARVLGGYTHLIVDAFRPILGQLNGNHIGADLPALSRTTIKVALLAHGTEIRDPRRHLERHEHSAFLDAPPDLLERITGVVEVNQRTARDSGLPLFVTTPDLLLDLPRARWAPLILDVDRWVRERPVLRRRRPVLVHAPSTRWTKGTDRVLPLLTELHELKLIELRLLEGVPHDQVVRQVRDADILLDQLVLGTHSLAGCEGMAAGCVVIAYLDRAVHDAVGIDPPMVNATPSTLGEAIESILDDRPTAAALAARGVRYVKDNHDGRRTARVYDEFLQ